MINHLDNMLRHLFMTQVEDISEETQVRFQPPDEDWRTYVSSLTVNGSPANALNVYLVDLRENRKLRSNERTQRIANGQVSETPAPRRIDCHYLISAWSPAGVSPAVESDLDEQALLYQVTAVLMNNEPLVPQRVYGSDPLPPSFPETIAEAELPTMILPVEGFPKLAEFWGAMGAGHRWKPAVYLVVTLPVMLQAREIGPMVTTRVVTYHRVGYPGLAEEWIQVAGLVLDARTELPQPLDGVAVHLETPTGEELQATETNQHGQFAFGKLARGEYRLRARHVDLGEVTRDREIPPPRGAEPGYYDLRFE